jgi:hypothetical protein
MNLKSSTIIKTAVSHQPSPNRNLMKKVYNKKCTKYSRIEKFVSKLHKEILDLHGWYVPSDVKTQKSDAIVY